MNSITFLQISESVVHKSAEVASTDPHGIIITVISVVVVFTALVILRYLYSLIGKIVNWELPKTHGKQNVTATRQQDEDEVKAAIATAMNLYLNENCHDDESYIITIKRKQINETV